MKNVPHSSLSFVKAGKKSSSASKPSASRLGNVRDGVRDYQMLVDYAFRQLVFPLEIYFTDQRSDMVIWSLSFKTVFLIELKCPAEENFGDAYVRKLSRYLAINDSGSDESACTIPYEVGACGFVASSTRSLLNKLGLDNSTKSAVVKSRSAIVARAAYANFHVESIDDR